MFGIKISFDGRISNTAKNVRKNGRRQKDPWHGGAEKNGIPNELMSGPGISPLPLSGSSALSARKSDSFPPAQNEWLFASPILVASCVCETNHRRRNFRPEAEMGRRTRKNAAKIPKINFLLCKSVIRDLRG